MVVRTYELVEDGAPLLGTLAVAGALAGEHQRAADVRKRLEGGGLATCRCRHGLVETSEAAVRLSKRDVGEAQLRKRTELEVHVAGEQSDVESSGGKGGCGLRAPRRLGACEVEPALLSSRRYVAEETLGTREPAARRGVVVESEQVLTGEPERDSCRARKLPVAPEPRVGALSVDDGAAFVPKPPQRAPESVERLR